MSPPHSYETSRGPVVFNGAILEHAKTCSFRDYIILRLLWRSGMRVSELLALTPSDLEPYNQVLNITKAKGKKQRRVVVDPPMFAMLSTYISETNSPRGTVHLWPLKRAYLETVSKIR